MVKGVLMPQVKMVAPADPVSARQLRLSIVALTMHLLKLLTSQHLCTALHNVHSRELSFQTMARKLTIRLFYSGLTYMSSSSEPGSALSSRVLLLGSLPHIIQQQFLCDYRMSTKEPK